MDDINDMIIWQIILYSISKIELQVMAEIQV